ncbi:MAG TPA: cupin domain-containing protein [Amycolatopsis sp.]|jgi:quercetin dioxygenase-like cupin family protein|nr:cupin domain-containing protein [Amycolatopsis sp.]
MSVTERPTSHFTVSVSHPEPDSFQPTGLRSFFEYRDLGIREATKGEFNAQVVRALPGEKGSTGWHYHPLTFQLVYCLRGWEDIAFEDGRLVRLEAGTCVNIPPGVGHNEIGYSDDLEALVIFAPESFETVSIPEPATAP